MTRWERAYDLRMKGLLYREIGAEFGVCIERARQLVEKERRIRKGELTRFSRIVDESWREPINLTVNGAKYLIAVCEVLK